MQGISSRMRQPSISAPCKAYALTQLVFVAVQYVAGLLFNSGCHYSPPVRMSVSTAGRPSVPGAAISCPHEGPRMTEHMQYRLLRTAGDQVMAVTRAATALEHARGDVSSSPAVHAVPTA